MAHGSAKDFAGPFRRPPRAIRDALMDVVILSDFETRTCRESLATLAFRRGRDVGAFCPVRIYVMQAKPSRVKGRCMPMGARRQPSWRHRMTIGRTRPLVASAEHISSNDFR